MPAAQVSPMDWQVLQAVHRLGAVAQHKLAEAIGRRRSTVNGAVRRLLATGWLVRAGQAIEGRGRPAILLAVNRSHGCFAGIDLAADTVHVAAMGADGTLLDRVTSRLGTDRRLAAVVDQIDVNLRGLLSRVHVGPEDLLGIWTGINGAVDEQGVVVTCASLRWHNEPLRAALVERYGCYVLVQGGASAMNAAAESLMGAGRDADSMVYYHVGRGISAGFVRRGQLLSGATRRAGEIGHVVVEPGGPACACGNRGCLEAVASGPAMARAIRRLPARSLSEPLRRQLRRRGSRELPSLVRAAFERCKGSRDPLLRALVRRITHHLAMGAAMAVAAYDPEVLVLGGYVFENNAPLIEGVRRLLPAMILDWDERNLRVVEGEVMSQDRAVGGAAELCQRFWANPRGVLVPA